MVVTDLKEARLSPKEKTLLEKNLRASKKTKINLSAKKAPARDESQTPPYAILPLLPHIPKEFIIWESAASKYGFLGEAIRSLAGNVVMESGMDLDGTDYFKTPPRGDMEITNPPYSNPLKFRWIERAYDNRKPFALLMPFETWAAARAQRAFQRFGMSIIILNRRINFHMPYNGWKGTADFPVAWFTWGLATLKEPVTYGYIPKEKSLPTWMVRPDHKRDITKGAKSMSDRLALKQATRPLTWPTGGRQ